MPDRTAFVERAATREIIPLLKIPHVRVFFFFSFQRSFRSLEPDGIYVAVLRGPGGDREVDDSAVVRSIHFPLKHEVCQLTFIIPQPPAATESAARLFVSPTIRTRMSRLVLGRWRHRDFKLLRLNDVCFPADEERHFVRLPSSLPL